MSSDHPVQYYDGPESTMEDIQEKLPRNDEGFIEVKGVEEGIAIVTLNQDIKRNAVNGKMMTQLERVVDNLEKWAEGKGVILKGQGGHFCSGGDLDFARNTNNAQGGFDMATYMHNILNRFKRLPIISVALIEGAGALGGGAEIATACDFRLITNNCKGIGFVHAKLGIIPAWGGTGRLVTMLGQRKALNIIASAKIMTPEMCREAGLVDEIIPSTGDPTAVALNWLRERTKHATEAVRGLKYTITNVDDDKDGELERRVFAPLWGGPANKAALERNLKHK